MASNSGGSCQSAISCRPVSEWSQPKRCRSPSRMRAQQIGVFSRLNHCQGNPPNVVQNARGICGVFVEQSHRCKPFRNDATCQIVPPKSPHRRMTHRLAKISPRPYRNAHALKRIGAEHRNRLLNVVRGITLRIKNRIRHRKHFAREEISSHN